MFSNLNILHFQKAKRSPYRSLTFYPSSRGMRRAVSHLHTWDTVY